MRSKENTQNTWVRVKNYVLLVGFVGFLPVITLQSCKEKAPSSRVSSISGTTFEHEGNLTFIYGDSATVEIEIEIAENEAAITQGLMYRKSMDFNRGMLFIFPNSENRSFWMENTIIPLDIIFVSEDKEIVAVKDHTTPFSTASVPSDGKDAKYVVEVNAGFAGKYGIKVGDKIDFNRL